MANFYIGLRQTKTLGSNMVEPGDVYAYVGPVCAMVHDRGRMLVIDSGIGAKLNGRYYPEFTSDKRIKAAGKEWDLYFIVTKLEDMKEDGDELYTAGQAFGNEPINAETDACGEIEE